MFIYLISERILGVIGKKKSIELMYATEDIEEQGGMKTNVSDKMVQ